KEMWWQCASCGAMEFRGLSVARISQLVEAGLVHDIADLYDLQADRLAELERLAEKSAEALVVAIEASKAQPLSKLLFALGVKDIGETVAKQIAKHFGTMDAIMEAAGKAAESDSLDDVLVVHGIGETIAQSLVSWFADPKAPQFIARLRAPGL